MRIKPPSLRRALFRQVALPLLACSLLVWLLGLNFIYHEVDEVYDATLVQFAKEVDQLTAGGTLVRAQNPEDSVQHKYERKISYRIVRGGRTVAQSAGMQGMTIEPDRAGFYNLEAGGEKWRVFGYGGKAKGAEVIVAEKYDVRYEMILQLLGSLVVPALLFLFAVLGVVWWGVARSLRKLVALSAQVDARAVDDMSPVEDPTIPREVQPLLAALNRLFRRVSESVRREREFSDNAAHELRTPLAAIKTQAQVLEKSEKLSKEGRDGFSNLLAAIDRAANMVDSLLVFTRLQAGTGDFCQLDFSALVQQEIGDITRFSAWNSRKIDLDIQPGIVIEGSAQGLAILVRNVVLNALKFTPREGRIEVSLKTDSGETQLTVADTGPGIPEDIKDKVFDRFFKGKKSNASGSGLGLAMVKWVADLHGAKIFLDDNIPSGLKFRVVFG